MKYIAALIYEKGPQHTRVVGIFRTEKHANDSFIKVYGEHYLDGCLTDGQRGKLIVRPLDESALIPGSLIRN